MKRLILIVCSLLSLLLLTVSVRAAESVRSVSMEWETVPEASSYEIEFRKVASEDEESVKFTYQSETASWTGSLPLGIYQLRVRSFDERKVPGPWSAASEFAVQLSEVVGVRPKKNELVALDGADEGNVEFAWKAVSGAALYKLQVRSKDGRLQKEVEARELSARLELSAGESYLWRVIAQSEDGHRGQEIDFKDGFRTIGARLEPPEIHAPKDEFVSELSWSRPKGTERYSYRLQRKLTNGNWRLIEKNGRVENEQILFAEKYPGGLYRLSVRAESARRKSSEYARLEFKAKKGDRSPAAAELARMRAAMERPTNFFAVASYFISSIAYEGEHPETAQNSKFSAIGGTGRLGLGYIKKQSNWGYLAIADLGGVLIGGRNFTFPSAEMHGVYRRYFGFTQLRVSSGAYYKSLPDLGGDTPGDYKVQTVSAAGPHLGFDIWHPLSSQLGVQVNARAYYSLLSLRTPNGLSVQPSLSYNFGILGSYRLSAGLIGFLGYAYRLENLEYKAVPDAGDGSNLSLAGPDERNRVKMSGHFLNLMLELSY